jgi:hypothetical protein
MLTSFLLRSAAKRLPNSIVPAAVLLSVLKRLESSSLPQPAQGCSASHRSTFASSSEPETLVCARPSESDRRQEENRDELSGLLTTTRGDLDCPPATVVERLGPSDTVVPLSTTEVCGSHNGAERTVLETGVPGAQGSVL